ncbi:MAG: hypothetical protein IPK13_14695 [Deltaproteobacteria bacterium]|nr:hypothetical protein [Deltaproteobacteria bacterium]
MVNIAGLCDRSPTRRQGHLSFVVVTWALLAALGAVAACHGGRGHDAPENASAAAEPAAESAAAAAVGTADVDAISETSSQRYSVVSDCDPVNDTGCQDGERCVWSVTDDSTTCHVRPPLETEPGDPCSVDEISCGEGQVCTALGAEEGTRCYALCDAASDFTCPTHPNISQAYVCMPLVDLSYGLCVLTGSQCDVLNPSTCDSDETCSVFGGVTSCVPAGDLSAGEDCSTASCASGLSCIKLSDRPTPVCLSPCDANTRECPNAEDVCVGLEGFSFGLCQSIVPECSPLLAPDTCGPTRACGMRGRFVSCLEPGLAPIGADCTSENCAAGGLCVRFLGERNAACREPCDLQEALCQDPSEACQDIGLDFGVCR